MSQTVESILKKTMTSNGTKKRERDDEIDDEYQKLTDIEHLLKRPDTYVGQIKKTDVVDWVINDQERMEERHLTVSPAAVKCGDEILINARDQSDKSKGQVTMISVDLNRETGMITVENNGPGIPVKMHAEHKKWIPEMIFSDFKSGTNFKDETQDRTYGGKNGIGAKATNGLSSYFEIETRDSETGKKYVQVWKNNMSEKSQPTISSHSAKTKNGTRVSFILDWKRFGMDGMEQDFYDCIKRRVYDIAACTPSNVTVKFNGEKVLIREFDKYVNMYIGKASETPRVYATLKNEIKGGLDIQWDVVACISKNGFQHVSFVNGLYTKDGGKHVDFVTSRIYGPVKSMLAQKAKGDIPGDHIKQQLWLFINAFVVNPDFDSQTKTKLTSKVGDFKFECAKLPDEFITGLVQKCKLGTIALNYGKFRAEVDATKIDISKTGSVKSIEKYEGANKAGTRESQKCTIMFTEGDSAKTLAVSGFSVVGRDYWGVFPLRGKFVNVKQEKFRTNKEFLAFMKILGLELGVKYTDTKRLRYGKIMFMTDQDLDGAHIQGLLMNAIAHLWPELLLIPGFICCFRTPIVKATKGKGKNLQIKTWFTQQEFEMWRKTEGTKGWDVAYLKGLGSSKPEDAKRYFNDKDKCIVEYFTSDLQKTLKNFDKAFHKDYADVRKVWLTDEYDRNNILDHRQTKISFDDFINKSLVHFFKYDLQRSLCSMVDGWKTSQRKVLFGARKKNFKSNMKVFQLGGAVAELADYHHGETSLQGTIVNMAQTFSGSNNINILEPDGQFGCLDPETKILMWDGSIKQAKDIVIGDKLVGDDGTPRNVLRLTSGIDEMFDIVQDNAETYRVNSEHVLTLSNTNTKTIIDISIKVLRCFSEEYLNCLRGINLRKEPSKITINPVGKGKFVGWQVDGNERFLLHDFTITHNSRVLNGKDASAARYISTKLSDICDEIFNPSDDHLLERREDDDGNPIEPVYYVPIIPMVLANGCEGIGTGFSLTIPAYNPSDIIKNMRNLLEGKDLEEMVPWYKDFKGKIEKVESVTVRNSISAIKARLSMTNAKKVKSEVVADEVDIVEVDVGEGGVEVDVGEGVGVDGVEKNDGSYLASKFKTTGVWSRIDDITIRITELPVGNNKCKSFSAYKEFLESLVVGKKKKEKTTRDSDSGNQEEGEEGAPKKKRKSDVKEKGPKEFLSVDPIVNGSDDYCDFIIKFVSKDILDGFINNGTLESKLKLTHTISTSNMYLFDENDSISKYNTVNDILTSFYNIRLDYYGRRKEHELDQLQKEIRKLRNQMQFLTLIHNGTINVSDLSKIPVVKMIEQLKVLMPNLDNEEYDSLLDMNFRRLTQDQIEKHKEKIGIKEIEYNTLKEKTIKKLWIEELNNLEKKIQDFIRIQLEEKAVIQSSTQKKPIAVTKTTAKKSAIKKI